MEEGFVIEEETTTTIAQRLKTFGQLKHEVAILVSLKENKFDNYYVVAKGTETEIKVSHEYIIYFLMRHGIKDFILVHNHPSGNPIPSHQDILFLNNLLDKLKPKEIYLRDSIIIGNNNFCSLQHSLQKKQWFVCPLT